MAKVGNLKAKVGSYTNQSGETKGKYIDVGVLMESDNGGFYVLLNPTFNPAGVTLEQGKDMVMVSVFQDQDNQGQQQNSNQPNNNQQYQQQQNYNNQQQPQQQYSNQNQGYGNQ